MIKERKRFVDSATLNAGYFLNLSPDQRLFWLMLQMRCDCIGQFDMTGELLYAERMHGLDIDPENFMKAINQKTERLREMTDGHYWVVNFIREQYGKLTPACPPHRKYLRELQESGLWETFSDENPDLVEGLPVDYQKGSDRLSKGYTKASEGISKGYAKGSVSPQEQEKEKEEEADKEKDEEKETPLSFEKRNNSRKKKSFKIESEIPELDELPFG